MASEYIDRSSTRNSDHKTVEKLIFSIDSERQEVQSGSDDFSNNGTFPPAIPELKRDLNERMISMIAIAGIIGTGLFLGTGKSLATGGPGSLIICYSLIGFVVYLTMLSLGEMSTYMPVSGSFGTYARTFGSESFGFAILVNYWFNDAVSVASDLTALQLVMSYWTDFPFYVISLIFWVFLLALNIFSVKIYGNAEYVIALLKIIAIIMFFVISIVVNAGHNIDHHYIGFQYWALGEAPFVNGFKGFASVFVTASFAYGGCESIALTAAEMKNPIRGMPSVIKTVFWRILIFYVASVFFIGMNVPYNYPNLSNKSVTTSPYTIVFSSVGATGMGSFMNAVILTSVISAGNHALYAGSRLAFTLGSQSYIPKIFTKTNRFDTPYVAVIFTWLCGGLCFGSSFIGAGELWSWLQNLVGVSNQIAWLTIGIISIRFRKGMEKQGKTDQLTFKNWTYPFGPYFVVIFVSFIILVQGWSSFSPWDVSNFFSYYVELIVFPVCYAGWWLYKRDIFVKYEDMDFETGKYIETEEEKREGQMLDSLKGWEKVKQILYRHFT